MDHLLNLAGRTAVVWGGGAGMGEATVRRLVEAGCAVGVVDIDGPAAERVAGAVVDGGGKAVAVTADVREEDQVQAAVARVSAALGCPTLSASVVGMALFKPFLEMTAADWDVDHHRNLRHAFLTGRAVATAMKAAGQGGAIAYVASISGLQSAYRHASYGAAKAGLRSLVQSMALELGPLGIRVNAVAPGPIRTARFAAAVGAGEATGRKLALGRVGEVDEMAKVLLFLLSDMSSFITGQTVVADGGWMIVPPGVADPTRDA